MDNLIKWSLHNKSIVLLLAIALMAWGANTALNAPVDVFPDLSAPTVTVVTETHGMASTEVEKLVSFPIESSLNGAAGIRRVRSSSAVGISIVYAEFDWGTDIFRARQIVAEKLRLISNALPQQSGEPILAPISSIMGEILFIGLSSTNSDPLAARTFADTIIRRRLLAVPGVSQVTNIGGGVRQYQVILDPIKLDSFIISPNAIAEAIRVANKNISAGFLAQGSSEYLITGLGRFQNVEDIANLTVESRDGVAVRIKDLGRVEIGARPTRGTASVQAKNAVLIGIQKQPATNTLELTIRLDQVIDELEDQLPPDLILHRDLLRQADFIATAVDNILTVLRDGAFLVVLIVAFFLANLRATFIALTAIPLSLLGAVLVLEAFGSSINTMTIGGMAIAIGALVDDAIIDVENVLRRLRENASKPPEKRRTYLSVVFDASVEIRASIVFATLIIMLVFIPLFFLPGVEGRLLQPLGMAYVAALAASLIVAVTVTPVLCYFLLPNSRAAQVKEDPRHIRSLKRTYQRLLRPVLHRPALALVPTGLLFVGALLFSSMLGRSFLPEFNEGALTVSATTLPGTSLEQSDALGRLVETTFMQHPEVVSVARRTGRAELDEHANGVELSELEVRLEMKDRSRAEFLSAVRTDLQMVPGMIFTIGQPISHRIDHMLSGTRAAIAIKIFGPDLQELRNRAQTLHDSIASIPGVVDLAIEQQASVPAWTVKFDRQAMGRLNVNPEQVAIALEAAVQGYKVTELLEGNFSFDLNLRLELSESSLISLKRIPVSPTVQLGAVADFMRQATPNQIKRENGQRKLVVSCNVAERDLVSVVEDIKTVVLPQFDDAPDCRVEFGGQFESAQAAQHRIFVLSIAIIIGIALLLRIAFNSGRDAMFVMANLPLALIGGVAGAWLGGGILSIGSLIGFITVFGVAARNGIMLVAHIKHLQIHEGVNDLRQAVMQGSTERLVPILMTAAASGMALVPLALAGGEPGSEIQTPMAWVILFGLITSTILNMIVVPTLYLRFGRTSKKELA